MTGQLPLDHSLLPHKAVLVDSSSQASHVLHRLSGHDRGNRRACGGVPNTHFTGADQTDALTSRVGSDLDADHDRLFRRGSIHGGSMKHISSAHHQLAVRESGNGPEIMGHPDVDDTDLDVRMAG